MKTHTILIVDDESDFLSSMRRSLRKEPYALRTAANGAEALKIMENQEICLVVSDYLMPGMDGLSLIKQITARYPRTLSIMLTALSDVDIAMRAINDAGVYKFILKPVEINSLRITLQRALESLDLITENEGLLQKIKSRDAILQKLEAQHPGITKVERDENGYVLSLE